MTTIAYDGNIIACDSLISGGNSIYYQNKLCIISFNICDFYTNETTKYCSILGTCGSQTAIERFIRWYRKSKGGLDLDIPRETISGRDELRILEIRVQYSTEGYVKSIYHWDDDFESIELPDRITAIGSGAQYAIGAIESGKNSIDSIIIAEKHDNNTGGDMFYVSNVDIQMNSGHISLRRKNIKTFECEHIYDFRAIPDDDEDFVLTWMDKLFQ
jgi:hypothetical protein